MCEIINKYLKKKTHVHQINNIKSSISKIWSIQMNLTMQFKHKQCMVNTNESKKKLVLVDSYELY